MLYRPIICNFIVILNEFTNYRSEIMRYNGLTQKCCTLNTRMAIASLCVWSLIFCLSIFGMNRIRKVTINVQFVFGAMLLIVALYSVSFAEGMDKSVSLSPETRMDKFEVNTYEYLPTFRYHPCSF